MPKPKDTLDYSVLADRLTPKKPVFKLAEVERKLVKVAWDVVRFRDNEIDGLWKIEKDDQGEYIVAMYDEGNEESMQKSASISWKAMTGKEPGTIQVFYREVPVTKISMASLGMPTEDASFVASFLPNKLAESRELVSGLLKDVPEGYRSELVKRFPELGNK